MHLQDARLDLGEELASVVVKEDKRTHRDRQRDDDETATMVDRLFKSRRIRGTELIEATLERLLET